MADVVLNSSGVGSQGPKVMYQEQCLIRTLEKLVFKFATNGSSNPVATTIKGLGVKSITLGTTGLYTVTLADYWNAIISAKAHLGMATPDGSVAQIVTGWNVLTGPTLQIQTLNNSGSAANIAAAAGNQVSCCLWMSNSSFGAGL